MAMYGTKLPYQPTEEDKKYFSLTTLMVPDQYRPQLVLDSARHLGDELSKFPPFAFLQAIDTETGDSALHIVAKSAALDAVSKISMTFDDRNNNRFYRWGRHALFVHQNHAGDTIFHVAARSGKQNLLTMLFRTFENHWSASCPEVNVMDDGPPEDEIFPVDLEYLSHEYQAVAPKLLLLITRNKMGRDAAAEARHAGNEDLARWLDAVVLCLDRGGKRRQEARVAEMTEYVKDSFCHNLIRERDVGNQMGF